jgi:hypothetical protein
LPSPFRLNRRGMAPRLFVASAGRKVQVQSAGSDIGIGIGRSDLKGWLSLSDLPRDAGMATV